MEPHPAADDLAAIHRVLSGDVGAFREIVERYGDRVLGFCRSRLGSEEEAADAAQDVFLRVFRSLRTFRLGDSFPSWLFAIAANRVRTRRRRRGSEGLKVEKLGREAALGPSPDPSEAAACELDSELIRRRVSELPTDLRRVVELYYFAELSVAECSRALHAGEEAIKSRLHRARKRLRESLGETQPKDGSGGIL